MIDQIDKSIFLFLNSLHSPFWDNLMWIISAKLTWIPLYLIILVIIGIKEKRRLLLIFLLIILTVAICDQVSVHLFKEVFERLRPCHEPELEGLVHIVNGKCGGRYGFVSSHAANSFGIASISLLIIKRRWFAFSILFWASLVSYSRIYLGVHYPGDVIGGAILGIFAGLFVYWIYLMLKEKYLDKTPFFKLES